MLQIKLNVLRHLSGKQAVNWIVSGVGLIEIVSGILTPLQEASLGWAACYVACILCQVDQILIIHTNIHKYE